MNIFNRIFIAGVVSFAIVASSYSVLAKGGRSVSATSNDSELDINDLTHLVFMREEEKLARDVYIKLGLMYPDRLIFGNIDDSEQRHTMSLKAMIEKYGYVDPSTNDNIGIFTGEDYGWYFTEKYSQLVARATVNELEALYVGAFIEELDVLDINQCPRVVVETDNDIAECGRVNTDNPDIEKLYGWLLAGSRNHLKAYVKNIENYIGAGNYQAQVLRQDQVDELLGR